MGATKYTDAERVTVLGLYVENVRFGEIVTRSGLDRKAVASILGNMYRKSSSIQGSRILGQRLNYAASKPEPTPLQPRARPTL